MEYLNSCRKCKLTSNKVAIIFSLILVLLVYKISNISKLQKLIKSSRGERSDLPLVLLILIDGFRHDFLTLYKKETVNLNKIADSGVRVKYMKPIFVTSTYANIQSISTGLFSQYHGILDNHVFDESVGEDLNHFSQAYYSYSKNITPIWILNEMNGEGRKSGVIDWPGAEYGYTPKSLTPSFSKFIDTNGFGSSKIYKEYVNTVFKWFTDKSDSPNFIMLYFGQPDLIMHREGVKSPKVKAAIKKVDDKIGHLMDKLLSADNLNSRINWIIISDHGVQDTNTKLHFDIENYISTENYDLTVGSYPVWQIKVPNAEKLSKIINELEVVLKKYPGLFKYYEKKDIPEEYYMKAKGRIHDILVVSNLNFEHSDKNLDLNTMKKEDFYFIQTHGYDNKYESMGAIFIASGPKFKKNFVLDDTINNLDLMPMLCSILEIPEPPNNGSLKNIEKLFLEDEDKTEKTKTSL